MLTGSDTLLRLNSCSPGSRSTEWPRCLAIRTQRLPSATTLRGFAPVRSSLNRTFVGFGTNTLSLPFDRWLQPNGETDGDALLLSTQTCALSHRCALLETEEHQK